jgi:hypothetical protein
VPKNKKPKKDSQEMSKVLVNHLEESRKEVKTATEKEGNY